MGWCEFRHLDGRGVKVYGTAPDSGAQSINWIYPVPSTATVRRAAPTATALIGESSRKGAVREIVFKFPVGLDIEFTSDHNWGYERNDIRAPQTVSRYKSNIFGRPLEGAFSEVARILKDAGASAKYGVKSPLTLFAWTAYDLAKYCDRIIVAMQSRKL